jgi:phosphatidylglycerophosphate synthase
MRPAKLDRPVRAGKRLRLRERARYLSSIMKRESLATLPNLISLSRLGLAAAFVVLKGTTPRLIIIAAAGATDFLDGYLARRGGSTSKWGALIDPIADRFFVFAAVCALLFDGALGIWQYAILISRDFMTAVGFLTARAIPWLRRVRFKSRMSGKVVTVLQLGTLALVFVARPLVNVALVLVGIVSLISISDYTLALWHARARA